MSENNENNQSNTAPTALDSIVCDPCEPIVPPSLTVMHPPSSQRQFVTTSAEVGDMMRQIVNLTGNDRVYVEPTCPICGSSCREEAEQVWINTKKVLEVKTLMNDRCGLKLSVPIIENHMQNHYLRGVKEVQKLEYIDKIKRLNDHTSSTLDQIQLGLSMLLERLIEVNGISPSGELSVAEVERIKSAETSRLIGQQTNLLKLKASILGEMRNNGELLTIPVNDFAKIFNDALTMARNDGERQLVKNIIDQLSRINKG